MAVAGIEAVRGAGHQEFVKEHAWQRRWERVRKSVDGRRRVPGFGRAHVALRTEIGHEGVRVPGCEGLKACTWRCEDRQTDRQTGRQAGRQAGKQTSRQRERDRESERERETERERDRKETENRHTTRA